MKTKKPLSKGMNVYLLFLIVQLFALNGMVLYMNHSVGTVIGGVLGLLGFAASIYYMIDSYSKDAALSYKLYMITLFLAQMQLTVHSGVLFSGIAAGVPVFAACLSASCALVLAASHDLGKRNSMILCGVILVLTLAMCLISIMNCPGLFRGGSAFYTVTTARLLSNFCAAQIAGIMTLAKYGDKDIRKNA